MSDQDNIDGRKAEAFQLVPSVIQTISPSASVQTREAEKKKVEKAFGESDKKLEGLLTTHHDKLTLLIEAFNKINGNLRASKEDLTNIRENLLRCKKLLHCKRDELTKFWIDGVEQNTIVEILGHIDSLRSIPERLEELTRDKVYVNAASTLTNAISILREDLGQVGALWEVRDNILKWRTKLVTILRHQLNRALYFDCLVESTRAFAKFRHDSIKGGSGPPGTQSTGGGFTGSKEGNGSSSVGEEAHPSPHLRDLLESLGILNELKGVLEGLKESMRADLMGVVRRASQEFVAIAHEHGELDLHAQESPLHLTEFLQLCLKHLQVVALSHSVLVGFVKNRYQVETYTGAFVWDSVQSVIIGVLRQYLPDNALSDDLGEDDMGDGDLLSGSAGGLGLMVNGRGPLDFVISQYSKKKLDYGGQLFRFDRTENALTLSDYLLEVKSKQPVDLSKTDIILQQELLVCRPTVSNLTSAYRLLDNFCVEIEMSNNVPSGTCALHVYLDHYTKTKFVTVLKSRAERITRKRLDRFDALKSVTDARLQLQLSAPKPILKSVIIAAEAVETFVYLMREIPEQRDQFLNMLLSTLATFKSSTEEKYKELLRLTGEEERILSEAWARDDDISRFLRSMPNWAYLKGELHHQTDLTDSEVKAMNVKESSMLASNLTAGSLIQAQEIIGDPEQLKILAQFHESLEWLSYYLDYFKSTEGQETEKDLVADGGSLDELAVTVDKMSEICLLVLHLEVRVHCFYYIMPVATQFSSSDGETDSNVLKLNRDLMNIEETLQDSLPAQKCRYIFDGLGHLVSSLLIKCVQHVPSINDSGIQMMCRNIFALKQSLDNVTSSRETDLDLAKLYYELLSKDYEEILDSLMLSGSKFSEFEYVNLFQLKNRSQPTSDFESKLTRLKNLIREKHVYSV